MKKLLILFLFTSLIANTQQRSISLGFDPAVATYGGGIDLKGADLMFRFSFNNDYEDVWSNDEVGIFYEKFKKIGYQNVGIFFNKEVYPKIRNTALAFGIEGSVIERNIWNLQGNNKVHSYWWSYGFNLEPRYDINNSLRLSLLMNFKRRTDIELWRYSNYILISYRF